MPRTLRDFKKYVEREARVGTLGDFTKTEPVVEKIRFIEKLNEIGARRVNEMKPEEVKDIDETVLLSDAEWDELDLEPQKLLRRIH